MNSGENGESYQRDNAEKEGLKTLEGIHLSLIPKFGENWNEFSLVTLRRQSLSRLLYLDWIYKKLVGKPGVICEFGVLWGTTTAILQNLRGIYEPYNHQRKIFAFDTFTGFTETTDKDNKCVKAGDYSVYENYEDTLEEILNIHETQSPLSHIKKFELIKGDASETIVEWMRSHEALSIALAIFDMDLHRPTKEVLEAIKPRLYKGSVLVFDEFSIDEWPGETLAIDEVFGLNNLRFEHHPHQPNCAVCVLE